MFECISAIDSKAPQRGTLLSRSRREWCQRDSCGLPLWIAIAIMVVILLGATPALARTDPDTLPWNERVGWVRIPVYFVTERRHNIYANGLDYFDDRDNQGPKFGMKYLVVPLMAHNHTNIDDMKAIGWYKLLGNSDMGPASLFIPKDLERFSTKTLTESEFFESLKQTVSEAPNHELALFAHGCCTNYAGAMDRAGTVAEWFRCPVVVFDWASPNGLQNYLSNETTVDQSRDGFISFLDKLLASFPANSLTLVGHSMGNRFLDTALVRRADVIKEHPEEPRFREVVLAGADVDAIAYLNHCGKTAQTASITRIYISDQDKALWNSQYLLHKFPRVGNPGKYLNDLCRTDGQDVIDVSLVGALGPANHDMPLWAMGNMHCEGKPGEDKEFSLRERQKHYYLLVPQSK